MAGPLRSRGGGPDGRSGVCVPTGGGCASERCGRLADRTVARTSVGAWGSGSGRNRTVLRRTRGGLRRTPCARRRPRSERAAWRRSSPPAKKALRKKIWKAGEKAAAGRRRTSAPLTACRAKAAAGSPSRSRSPTTTRMRSATSMCIANSTDCRNCLRAAKPPAMKRPASRKSTRMASKGPTPRGTPTGRSRARSTSTWSPRPAPNAGFCSSRLTTTKSGTSFPRSERRPNSALT